MFSAEPLRVIVDFLLSFFLKWDAGWEERSNIQMDCGLHF